MPTLTPEQVVDVLSEFAGCDNERVRGAVASIDKRACDLELSGIGWLDAEHKARAEWLTRLMLLQR